MKRHALLQCGVCVWGLWLAGQAVAQSVRETVRETVPQVQPALSGEAPPPGASVSSPTRTLTWEQLIPAGWDPYKDLKALNLDKLKDNDPRAEEALKKMRKMWDNAPINPLILGQSVRLPGYMVPLEDLPEGSKEFLLVPYFGACVHSPPPPANQIVHVVLAKPTKRFRLMDTLWVTGTLSGTQTDSHMGMSGYRIDAQQIAPFSNKK
ncbi:DUF3299 domain-containing protein [Limnohabitans sp. G3-2]|uniref:DUF3299 domain-containing protein n=1 Tax=Limnohabitans sp. G3-2 TaxID=1100711 RepID=UPI000C1E6321|nr:DUF3299 domain-containing protein [Limnohabitans sp. G3-2]PIT75821.1 hypothetical protein B9Z31_06025 [Limnohabitans sp. G3-2]